MISHEDKWFPQGWLNRNVVATTRQLVLHFVWTQNQRRVRLHHCIPPVHWWAWRCTPRKKCCRHCLWRLQVVAARHPAPCHVYCCGCLREISAQPTPTIESPAAACGNSPFTDTMPPLPTLPLLPAGSCHALPSSRGMQDSCSCMCTCVCVCTTKHVCKSLQVWGLSWIQQQV